MAPAEAYESKGICAPGAIVRADTLHLFYQTYGGEKTDAICHAWSTDGLHFVRNKSNPVFRPSGAWTIGRAIDAEVVKFNGRYFLYFATRDTSYKIQMQGVATTPLTSTFGKSEWSQAVDSSILKPQLPWEKSCIEAASCVQLGEQLYMFYAGGYNNEPQQIGLARSSDGIRWERLSEAPFLPTVQKEAGTKVRAATPIFLKTARVSCTYFFREIMTRVKHGF